MWQHYCTNFQKDSKMINHNCEQAFNLKEICGSFVSCYTISLLLVQLNIRLLTKLRLLIFFIVSITRKTNPKNYERNESLSKILKATLD